MNLPLKKFKKPLRFDENYVSCYDVLHLLGVNNNEKKKVDKYKQLFPSKHGIITTILKKKWDCQNIVDISSSKEIAAVRLDNINQFVIFFLRSQRLTTEEIENIVDTFDLKLYNDLKSVVIIPHTEKEICASIMKCIPVQSIPQFAIGSYRIDLYFPTEKIALEVDEYGHTAYNENNEIEREKFITEQLSCDWIRFDPYDKNFCIFRIIRLILKKLKFKNIDV